MSVSSEVVCLVSDGIKEAIDYYFYDITRFNGYDSFGNKFAPANAYEFLSDLSLSELCGYLRENLRFSIAVEFDGFLDMAYEDFDPSSYRQALSSGGVYDYLREAGSGNDEDDIDELVFGAECRHYDHKRYILHDACLYSKKNANKIYEGVISGLAKKLINNGI